MVYKSQDIFSPHRWFAWYPVSVTESHKAWLQFVYRVATHDGWYYSLIDEKEAMDED